MTVKIKKLLYLGHLMGGERLLIAASDHAGENRGK